MQSTRPADALMFSSAASGAGRVPRSVGAPSAGASTGLAPGRVTVISGRLDDYEIVDRLDRETASNITRQTGLPIAFPPGEQWLGVVTTWTEDPSDKLSLGQGASGVFCIARSVNSQELVGLKISEGREGAEAEIAVQRALKGVPHILQAIDFGRATLPTGEIRVYQIIKLAGLGSVQRLGSTIRALDDNDLQERLLYHIARGILRGLKGMHAADYGHLDVKPDNVVVADDGEVLIIDFDCAVKLVAGRINALETRGDGRYFSPERTLGHWSGSFVEAQCDGGKVDAWGAGLLLLELATGRADLLPPDDLLNILNCPFDKLPSHLQTEFGGTESLQPRDRLRALFEQRLALGSLPTTGVWQVMRGLLAYDPAERLTVHQALVHPWFAEVKGKFRATRDATLLKLKEIVYGLSTIKRSSAGASSPQDLPPLSASSHIHRRELQQAVRSRLLSGATQTVLQGGPGRGKTQLATFMVSHDPIRRHFDRIVWFRESDNKHQIEGQYLTLARELGIADDKASFTDIFPRLRHYLQTLDKPWLMVFDNADDPAILADYIIPSGTHTLITTRSTDWPEIIPVPPLTDTEGRVLVEKLLQREEPDVDHLCKELEHLPLAIAQACAYIRNRNATAANYLQELKGGYGVLIGSERQDGHRNLPYSIQALYRLTFAELRKIGALSLLQRLACLSPDEIPEDVVDTLADDPQHKQYLIDYGILQPTDVGIFSIHRLPRREARSVRSGASRDELLQAMKSAMERLTEMDIDLRSTDGKTVARQLLLGGSLLERWIEFEPVPHVYFPVVCRAIEWVLHGCMQYCYPERQMVCIEAVGRIVQCDRRTLGPEIAPALGRVAEAICDYGMFAGRAGAHSTRVAFCQRALEVLTYGFGDDHPSLVRPVVIMYEEVDRETLERALAIAIATHGRKHADVATCLSELASRSWRTRDLDEAVELLRQAVEVSEEVNGSDHHLTRLHRQKLDSVTRHRDGEYGCLPLPSAMSAGTGAAAAPRVGNRITNSTAPTDRPPSAQPRGLARFNPFRRRTPAQRGPSADLPR